MKRKRYSNSKMHVVPLCRSCAFRRPQCGYSNDAIDGDMVTGDDLANELGVAIQFHSRPFVVACRGYVRK